MKLKKTDHSGYMIDEATNVVINKNMSKLDEYKRKVQEAKEIKELKSDISELKSDMAELKNLIKKALE